MTSKPNPQNPRATVTSSIKAPTRQYKPDSTRTILDGLIHSPTLFGLDRKVDGDMSQSERTNEGEFLPPVPQSTATLLYEAEAKIKAMSKSRSKPAVSFSVASSSRRFGQNPPQLSKSEALAKAVKLKQRAETLERNVATKAKEVLNKDPNTDSSIITPSNAFKWLRPHSQQNRNIVPIKKSKSQTDKDLVAQGPEKMITVGGYIINIEPKLPGKVSATVSITVSSNQHDLNLEVCIREVDPSKIVVEKRYNSILVIGVKESGVLKDNYATHNKAKKSDSSVTPPMDNEFIELVNIFTPREVYLTRVTVSPTDSKGRVIIKAPLHYSNNSYMSMY